MSLTSYVYFAVCYSYTTVCSGADQRKYQSFASLAFVRGIHRSPVDSPHKGPITRKMLPFDDVIMTAYMYVHWPLVPATTLLPLNNLIIRRFVFAINSLWPCDAIWRHFIDLGRHGPRYWFVGWSQSPNAGLTLSGVRNKTIQARYPMTWT